ncbi:MAG: hypothetical protein E7607_00575 [Ruminococcaceae bacterium]|nr:hypothetical protein [Oscillospiraceae bacterium]
MEGKRIEVVERRVGDLKLDFGNPRKIKKQKREDLEDSLEKYGDFDIIVINEKNQVIGGNQRVTILQRKNPDEIVVCKLLIGYTVAEQKYVNIKLNSHAGEWDLEELGDWTADLMGDFKLDLEAPEKPIEERSIKDMEPIHYEQYDYVLIACRNELDYNDLIRKLGIEGGTVKVAKTRRIKGRAVWYDKMKAQIIGVDELPPEEPVEEGNDE